MKSSTTLQMAKCFEESLVQQALFDVYRKYNEKVPHELSLDLASYVRSLRHLDYRNAPALYQDLCLALFAGADVMEALRMAIRDLPVPSSIEELLTTQRREAKKKVSCSWTQRLKFMVSAFLSTRVGTLLVGKACPFDPRCFAKNIGGRFMEEQGVVGKGCERSLFWLVGATPTVGDHLSGEALQAILALKTSSSVFPYGLWVYCNLQGTRLLSERRRSHELLSASLQHIDYFRAASFSVDNPWYLDSASGRGTLMDHKKFVEVELDRAIDGKDSWYAFALKDCEKHEWSKWAYRVVEKSFVLSEGCRGENSTVFHELVLLGLIRSWQIFCAQRSKKDVLTTVACKECADRGGCVNAAFMWALYDGDEQDRVKNVEAVLWGRPLLARSRLNEHARTKGFLALVKAFSSKEIRDYLRQMCASPEVP